MKMVEAKLSEAKMRYAKALSRLEEISESIHQKRKSQQHISEYSGVEFEEESKIGRSSQTSPQMSRVKKLLSLTSFEKKDETVQTDILAQ